MSQAADIAERRQQMLAKLAELDLVAAEAAHASYLAALDTPQEAEKARTYQRMARSLRQSLALHERFDRAASQEAREAAAHARRDQLFTAPSASQEPRRVFPRDIAAADARADALRTAVRRVIWSEGFETSELESERDLSRAYMRLLEDWLTEGRCHDDFAVRPLDDHVAELCETLDLNPDNVARWRDLPDPELKVVKAWLEDLDGYARPPWRASG